MIRHIYRVEYATDQFEDVPMERFAQETEQGLWTSFADLTGADYGYDMIGTGLAAKKNAIERVAFWVVAETGAEINAKIDDLESHFQGRVWLWRRGDGEEGLVYERALARLVNLPQVSLDASNIRHVPVAVIFERMSDWEEVEEEEP